MDITQSTLGQGTLYPTEYDPSLLFPVARAANRAKLVLPDSFRFHGVDLWRAYELSWLDSHGKPCVAMAEFEFPCETPYLIESKSFKLYLNSINQVSFPSLEQVQSMLQADLSEAAGGSVAVRIASPTDWTSFAPLTQPSGTCIDVLAVKIEEYEVNASLLQTTGEQETSEVLVSHLLKSNCPVTGQPDWATIWISYTGSPIDRASLLRYLISYRHHSEFHEHCVESIFVDLQKHCHTETLTVQAFYTRRGGLDINPMRSSVLETRAWPWRCPRQ